MERLETLRLILRPFKESDVDDLYEYARDSRVGPAAGWPIHGSREESLEIIRTVFSAPHTFAMELKENGKVLGSVGYVDKHQTLLPGPDNEIGYAMSPVYWGRGLMPEAVREILRWGFEDLGLNAQWCGHYDFNNKSRRVVEKCGFIYRFIETVFVPLMNEERTELHYALTKEEWQGGGVGAPRPTTDL